MKSITPMHHREVWRTLSSQGLQPLQTRDPRPNSRSCMKSIHCRKYERGISTNKFPARIWTLSYDSYGRSGVALVLVRLNPSNLQKISTTLAKRSIDGQHTLYNCNCGQDRQRSYKENLEWMPILQTSSTDKYPRLY